MTAAIGPQATMDGKVGVTGEVDMAYDFGNTRLGVVTRGRGGAGWGDGGMGLNICRRSYGWTAAKYCGRIMAVELGSNQGEFVFGALSPAISIGLWQPTKGVPDKRGDKYGPTSIRPTHAFEVSLTLGLDVRPLRQFQGTQPYLALTFGGGSGASWY